MKYPMHPIAILLAAGLQIHAQSVALTGKVTDAGGKAIAGAVVALKTLKLSDTTDATGAYSISGATSAIHGKKVLMRGSEVSMNQGLLNLKMMQTQSVTIELFDLQGNRISQVMDKSLDKGTYRIDPLKKIRGANVTVIRVQVGDSRTQFLNAPAHGENAPGSSPTQDLKTGQSLAKATANEDTLIASALGYKAKSLAITSYTGTNSFSLEAEATGTCTASKSVNSNVKGSGTHSVVVETNSDAGIKEGTIFRPADLGPGKKYPILVWGEGGCSLNGLSNSASMAELASHGYFVIADGTPNGSGSRTMNTNNLAEMGKPVLGYITWAIAENRKPCSPYYQSLDTSKIGANGFSCGGLMAMGTASDSRTTTWGLSSSGSFSDNPSLWNSVHTPVIMIEGEKDDTKANVNGLRDYNGIAPLGHPVYYITHKDMGHGGDLFNGQFGGDFTKINLAWMNWWLKGDEGATGKGVLVGPTCTYCTNSNWIIKSANLP